jgi:HK97 family phage major capsid protein
MNAHVRPRGVRGVPQANTPEIKALIDGISENFNALKANHKREIGDLKSGLDDVATQIAALKVGGGTAGALDDSAPSVRAERQAIGKFAKTGSEAGLQTLPKAAMSADSDPDGGYLAAPKISTEINRKVFDVSPIARLARRVPLSSGTGFEEPQDPSDIGAEWVGEREARPNLDASTLKYLSVPLQEIYTSQPITQRLLDDSEFNIGAWLESKISDKFARKEGNAYISGDGINKPRGILTYDVATTGDSTRAWGTIQYIPTGQSGGFVAPSSTVNGADALFDVVYSLRAPYRPNARWLMYLATAGAVRKLKDAEGRFVWADAREGQPATLCGFPVELDEEMPNIAANTLSIAFGDIEQAYLIVDRPGVKLLRDPYTSKPLVLFYAYRRVGGALQNSEAIKLLKMAAS